MSCRLEAADGKFSVTIERRIVQVGKTMTIHVIAAALPIANEPISLSPMKGVAT